MYLVLFRLVLHLQVLQPGLPLLVLQHKIFALKIKVLRTVFFFLRQSLFSFSNRPASSSAAPASARPAGASPWTGPRLAPAESGRDWAASRSWMCGSDWPPEDEEGVITPWTPNVQVITEVCWAYVASLDVAAVQELHLPADAVPAVLDLAVHARHLLGLEAVHLPQQVFVQQLLLLLLESQHRPSVVVSTSWTIEALEFHYLSRLDLQVLLLRDLLLQPNDLRLELVDLGLLLAVWMQLWQDNRQHRVRE